MKNQALFSSKDKSKKLKCHLVQFLFGDLRVKCPSNILFQYILQFIYGNFGLTFITTNGKNCWKRF